MQATWDESFFERRRQDASVYWICFWTGDDIHRPAQHDPQRITGAPVERRHQERARALCLEQLAWELDRQGVELLTLEARPSALMSRDRRTVDALRGKQALPEGLRVDHALPSAEPMLWIAEQVLGALGESLSGGDPRWFESVRSATSIIELSL